MVFLGLLCTILHAFIDSFQYHVLNHAAVRFLGLRFVSMVTMFCSFSVHLRSGSLRALHRALDLT